MRLRFWILLVGVAILQSCSKIVDEPQLNNIPKTQFSQAGTTMLNNKQVDFDVVRAFNNSDGTMDLEFLKTIQGIKKLSLIIRNLEIDSVIVFAESLKSFQYLLLTEMSDDQIGCSFSEVPKMHGSAGLQKINSTDFQLTVNGTLITRPFISGYCTLLGAPTDSVFVYFDVTLRGL